MKEMLNSTREVWFVGVKAEDRRLKFDAGHLHWRMEERE
jgi:hypothetical protein